MAVTASKRGWGSPPVPRDQIVVVRVNGLVLPVHRRISELVTWLCVETERRGYGIRPDWSWGYAPRKIRGSTAWSNHGWGLAVDLNAPANPMGLRLITDMPGWMVDLWEAHGFEWGGRYRVRKDAMHYEFAGTPADADRLIVQTRGAQAAPKEDRPMANAPFVAVLVHPDGGYLRVGSDGGIFGHDAPFFGSAGGVQLNAPVVGAAWSPDFGGYWLAAADGGIFGFGNAGFHGSMGGTKLNQPIVGISGTGDGGYVLIGRDGGVFPFGPGAEFHGAEPLWAG